MAKSFPSLDSLIYTVKFSRKFDVYKEVLEYEDPFSTITVSLEDAKVTANKMLFIIMSDFMRQVVTDIEVSRVIIPHFTEKMFQNLIDLFTIGETMFESEEKRTFFMENIETLGMRAKDFHCTLKDLPSINLLDPQKSAEELLGRFHSKIDKFKVDDPNVCTFCLEIFRTKQACKNHEEICVKNPESQEKARFPCSNCNMTFKTKNGLKSHKNAKHRSIEVYGCIKCSKEYKNLSDLKRHCKVWKHKFPKEFCYESKEANDKTWCDVCFKFIKTDNFSEHKMNHAPEQHKCDDCDFTCNRKDSLHRHRKLLHHVHNVSISQLEANCTAELAIYDGQSSKVISTPKKLTYTCPKCQKEYHNKKDIAYHLSLKDCSEHICNICNIEFTLKSNLKRHLKKFHSS